MTEVFLINTHAQTHKGLRMKGEGSMKSLLSWRAPLSTDFFLSDKCR